MLQGYVGVIRCDPSGPPPVMVLPGLVLLPELDHGIGSSDEHVFLQKNSAIFPIHFSMQMAQQKSED